jgi:transposase
VSGARLDDAHQDSHQERDQGGGYRRIELITGEARRRPWSAEEKARLLAESFQPGAKVADVARRHGMNRICCGIGATRRANAAPLVSGFVPIRVVDAVAPIPPCEPVEGPPNVGCGLVSSEGDGRAGAVTGTIEIEIGAARVRVSGVVDAAALRQVLSHLRRKP